MEAKKMSMILFIAAIVIIIAGVKALFPHSAASKPNLWGYKSLCTFTPISSFILFWVAAVLFAVRMRIMDTNGVKNSYVWLIILSVLFVIGTGYYMYKYFGTSVQKSKEIERQ